jgi:hypothetical protein
MLRTLLLATIALLATWALLIVAAKRLPPGILKDLAGFLPACLTTIRRLRNNPQVPRCGKIAILVAGLWLLSPIDLLPEFLPVIGPLDDAVVVALALRYAARSVPARSCWTPGPPTPDSWNACSAHHPPRPRPGETPPDSVGNGRAGPAETPPRTALPRTAPQRRCADQAVPPRPVAAAAERSQARLPDLTRSYERTTR